MQARLVVTGDSAEPLCESETQHRAEACATIPVRAGLT
jgi:hypothetical protein